jgi:hypothetical protein
MHADLSNPFMNRVTLHTCGSLLLAGLSFAQAASPKPSCAFSGELLRDAKGNAVRFSSDAMKRRATHKVDVSDAVKQFDMKGTVVVDVIVGPSGEVVCTKTLTGHPIIQVEVEKALHSWTFEQAKVGDRFVAYRGLLEFTLCNISCGKEGINMSLLK